MSERIIDRHGQYQRAGQLVPESGAGTSAYAEGILTAQDM